MARADVSRTAQPPRTPVGAVLIGSLAAFGIITSGAVLAVVAAGALQWATNVPQLVDDGLPIVILLGAMLIAGLVAADIAGPLAMMSAAVAAATVGVLGLVVVKDTDAHGEAIDPLQVGLATLVVLLTVGGSAWAVNRHRRRRLPPVPGVDSAP